MASVGQYHPHGLMLNYVSPDMTLFQTRRGNLVRTPTGGVKAGMPAILDPLAFSVFHEDFVHYRASATGPKGGWKQTDIGNGVAANHPVITVASSMGAVLVTTLTASGDGLNVQWEASGVGNMFAAYPLWYSCAIMIPTTVANTVAAVGLGAASTDVFTAPNGVQFLLTAGALSLVVKNAAGTTTIAANALDIGTTGITLTAAKWYELSFIKHRDNTLEFWIAGNTYANRTRFHKLTTTTHVPVALDLDPYFAFKNSTTAARSLNLDFINVTTPRKF